MRRVGPFAAALLATLQLSAQTPSSPPAAPRPASAQPPVFRGGTNLVQVDAIVTDQDNQPVVDLVAADFTLLDDGKVMAIDRVTFLGAAGYSGDRTLAPIRDVSAVAEGGSLPSSSRLLDVVGLDPPTGPAVLQALDACHAPPVERGMDSLATRLPPILQTCVKGLLARFGPRYLAQRTTLLHDYSRVGAPRMGS